MTIVLSVIGFVVLLTVLVLVHEWGHYASAKAMGVTVEEFGFGLPPRAKFLFKHKGTIFSLNWIPFGGFVRLKGENSLDPNVRDQKGSFAAAHIPARLMILLAGVFMNLVVAVVLFTLGFWMWNWIPTYSNLDDLERAHQQGEIHVEWGLFISEVLEEGGASLAGVSSDGVLKAVNGQPVTTVDEVLAIQKDQKSVEYTLLYRAEDAGENADFDQEQVMNISVADGKTGVALAELAWNIESMKRSFPEGFFLSLRESWIVTSGTVKGIGTLIGSLFFTHRVPEGIAGIVGIAQLTHDSLKEGVMVYLRLVALLSLSLAVLNVLPFPALDGGRVLFVLYELVARRPANRRFEVMTNGIGILFLMLLMAAVTWNDIIQIFTSSSL